MSTPKRSTNLTDDVIGKIIAGLAQGTMSFDDAAGMMYAAFRKFRTVQGLGADGTRNEIGIISGSVPLELGTKYGTEKEVRDALTASLQNVFGRDWEAMSFKKSENLLG
ncbi:MAG: hypothetical protein IT567_00880 [Alphaproteobacteria bacterium]|nr:hypothetical protein [Alphaproteobacteria bacterium]